MSVPVDLGDLPDRLAEYGPVAFLVTTGAGGSPHVVSTTVELDSGALAVGAGRTSTANAASQPAVSLLWPAPAGADYCLIVDGEGAAAPGGLTVAPSRAVLHRLAGAPGDGPNCVTVL